jgi:hypothetical protein
LAIETIRTFVSTKYIGLPQTSSMALLGFAYADPQTFELFNKLGFATFSNSHISLTLPGWFTKGAPAKVELQKIHKEDLSTLYSVESKFVDRLVNLDATIDGLRDGTQPVSSDALNKETKRFVEMADDLSFGRENTFFIVFDRLVLEGTGGKSGRNTALVLEITPPGGEKVTKVLNAAKPVATPTVSPGASTGTDLAAGAIA